MKLPDRGEVSDQRGRGESRVTRSDLDEILGRLWIPARFSFSRNISIPVNAFAERCVAIRTRFPADASFIRTSPIGFRYASRGRTAAGKREGQENDTMVYRAFSIVILSLSCSTLGAN